MMKLHHIWGIEKSEKGHFGSNIFQTANCRTHQHSSAPLSVRWDLQYSITVGLSMRLLLGWTLHQGFRMIQPGESTSNHVSFTEKNRIKCLLPRCCTSYRMKLWFRQKESCNVRINANSIYPTIVRHASCSRFRDSGSGYFGKPQQNTFEV